MIHLYGDDLYIAEPWPALYIKSLDAIVIADLHLGVEGSLAEEGIFLPRDISENTINMVYKILDDYRCKRIILDGDVKHGFGLLNTSEWFFVREFYKGLVERELEVITLKGNHDNYLGVLLSKFGLELLDRFDYDIYSFIHGHVKYDYDTLNKVIIIGHEHPSITLRDDVGIKFKFKVFLWGEYREHYILVLPPIGELASGSDISLYMYEETLSPLLKDVDLKYFRPYAIVPGEAVQELPYIGFLNDLKNI